MTEDQLLGSSYSLAIGCQILYLMLKFSPHRLDRGDSASNSRIAINIGNEFYSRHVNLQFELVYDLVLDQVEQSRSCRSRRYISPARPSLRNMQRPTIGTVLG